MVQGICWLRVSPFTGQIECCVVLHAIGALCEQEAGETIFVCLQLASEVWRAMGSTYFSSSIVFALEEGLV